MADTATQQEYVEVDNNQEDAPTVITRKGQEKDEEETIDVSGDVEEDGDILEPFNNNLSEEGFNDGCDLSPDSQGILDRNETPVNQRITRRGYISTALTWVYSWNS